MSNVRSRIPLGDPTGMSADMRAQVDRRWRSVLAHGAFVGGPEVDAFERDFAAFCEADSCVGVGSGRDALQLILMGLDIGRADEVIVPTNTFVGTAEAVVAVGARPRFVDVDPDTLLLDPAAVLAAIRPGTVAVIASHLYGQMADCVALRRIADVHGLALIEDAAQAPGARDRGARAGSVGHAAAFSFYPGTILGAFGDGGAVVTSDADLADRVRSMADHGRALGQWGRHDRHGLGTRLDTLQAAVLGVKLAGLDADNRRRSSVMAAYRELLPDRCVPVGVRAGAEQVHQFAVVQVEDRGRVIVALTNRQIGWGVHYPVPCHRQPAFGEFERLPVAERASERVLSLPMSSRMTTGQVRGVCEVLAEALN